MEFTVKSFGIIIVTLLIRTPVYLSQNPDSIFVVTNNYCLTNSEYAMVFNPPIDQIEEHEDTKSYFYPSKEKEQACNIEHEDNCTTEYTVQKWQLTNSIGGNIAELLLDRRWEELRTYKSNYFHEDGETLFYKKVDISLPKDNFVIPFSVRLKNEGHVFLCEDRITNSNCYWILLQAWNGKTSAIRKCESGAVPTEKYPKGPCRKRRASSNHTTDILSDMYWVHFQIIMKDGTIAVMVNNDEPLLEFRDDSPFSPRQIFVHSKKNVGLWKFHTYTYLSTTEKSDFVQLGPLFKFRKGLNCIALYISMCEKCGMTIILADSTGANEYNRSSKGTPNEKWKEVKISYNSIEELDVRIYITTTLKQKLVSEKPFWAIDSVRYCDNNEFRVLTSSTNNATCQFLENNYSTIYSETYEISDQYPNCPVNTFGTKCLQCAAVGDDFCPPFKYCELYEGRKSCHCTAGFESKSCNEECHGYYGQGCTEQCSSNCLKGCNNINGTCSDFPCTDDFKGEKCDIPPAPLLKFAPKVEDIKTTSCGVLINNFEIIGNESLIDRIKIQYKDYERSEWIDYNHQVFWFNKGNIKTKIDDLKADTQYCVRALLFSPYKLDIYKGNAVKYECFNTTCTEYTVDDILITPYNTSAKVELRKENTESCRISNYKYNLDEREEQNMKETIEILNLEPYIRYIFNLRHVVYGKISKTFWTEDGVPAIVRNLKAEYFSSNSTIFLKWEEPSPQNGKLTYNVKYKMLQKDCSISFHDDYNVSTTNALLNVKPYAKYEINVGAQTRQATGEYSRIQRETDSSETLADNELPSVNVKDIFSSNVTVNISAADCRNIQGPIFLNFVAVCQSCHKAIHQNISVAAKTQIYVISSLQPYKDYVLIISANRDATNRNWISVKNETFMTKPSVPNEIDEIKVVSKDENSASLRWKPPSPPTGILAGYKINYKEANIMKSIEIDVTSCPLWSNYHCAAITNLTNNTIYNFEFYAKNKEPSDYKKMSKSIQMETIIETPYCPYDVTTTWTGNNHLNISWKHPDITNGIIKNFTINLNGQSQGFKQINSEEDYNLTYIYTMQKTNFTKPCAEYDISVTAYNEKYYNVSEVKKIRSPPPVPNISNSTIHITNDTNHTIFIEISKLEDDYQDIKNSSRIFYVLTSLSSDQDHVKEDIKYIEKTLQHSSDIQTRQLVKVFDKNNQSELPYNKKIETNNSGNKINRLYIYFVNKCYGKVEFKKVEKKPFSDPEITNKGIYALILLILLVPLIAYIYIYKIKRKQTTEGSLMSIIKPQRKKDIDEVPLSVNESSNPTTTRKSTKKKVMLPISASYVLKTEFSKPIKIIDFEAYVKRAIEAGELEEQHGKFPRGQTKPWEYGALKVNKPKNRYNNLVAYDHTRVKLEKIDGNEYSDYINANYIDGYRIQKAYIATQGPKSTTLNDFWRMIWQEKVENIVMLANIYEGGKKKVEKYWPNINETSDFNGIRVQYVSSKVYANYEYRVFKVFNKTEYREVNQLHFTSWPDHGVPLYSQSLVPFLQQMLKIPNNPQSPVVVHCSAGVGRTGTIILCDICLRMAAGEGSIDFLANLEHLRSQRPNMVDNVEQYKLAHLVVLECLFGMHTAVPCDENMNKVITKILSGDSITNQLRYLIDTEWEDRAMDTIWNKEKIPAYPDKNRFPDIVPDKNYQICLKYYPYNDESSSYINAVQVDGFRTPGRFIVTQQPLPNTVGDFWRMVWERQCTVIVSLNEINPKDKSSCRFWPKKGPEMSPVDYLKITCLNTNVLESYQITTVEMVNRKENESMQVKIITMDNWMPNELLPNSIENFLSFWEECDVISRNSDTVIVTCYDGVTASGLYIASTFLIDKMKLEQECDVCLAVRTIRHNRKQFVTSEEQFTFLYRVALMYIEGFQSYANFS